jgi:hypothetical protein
MNRPFIINLIFAGTLSFQAQMGPLEQGEASEAARGAAMSAIRGPTAPSSKRSTWIGCSKAGSRRGPGAV